MIIQSTRKGNSIYDEIKERLYIQYLIETQYAYHTYKDEELDDNLGLIEDNYDFNLFKLDELTSLSKHSEDVIRKFIVQMLYIENMEIPDKAKLENILTTACLLNYHSNLLMNLSENELYILSISSLNIGSSYNFDCDYEELLEKQINLILPVFSKTNEVQENQKKLTLM